MNIHVALLLFFFFLVNCSFNIHVSLCFISIHLVLTISPGCHACLLMCFCLVYHLPSHSQGSMGLKDSIIPRIPRQHYCSYGLIPVPSPFSFLSQDSPLPSPTGPNSYMFPSDAGSPRPHPHRWVATPWLSQGCWSCESELIKACLPLICPVSWATGACVCFNMNEPRLNTHSLESELHQASKSVSATLCFCNSVCLFIILILSHLHLAITSI